MKKFLSLYFLLFLTTFLSFSQPPQAINYQGVARDSAGHPLLNQNISIRLSVLDSSATGQTIYMETHSVITNNTGLFNLSIGMGAVVIGNFSSINWGQNNKWLQNELDATGGSNYQLLGTTQFLSVPYALHAATANMITPSSNSLSTFTMISSPNPGVINFWEAMDFCYNLTEGGYTDWRLPTYQEIEKYVELNGLPISVFSTFTQTQLSNGLQVTVILKDFNNSLGYGTYISLQRDVNQVWPKIQCVR